MRFKYVNDSHFSSINSYLCKNRAYIDLMNNYREMNFIKDIYNFFPQEINKLFLSIFFGKVNETHILNNES